jgi:acyl carrier protein
VENFFYGEESASLTETTSFMETGVIDSTGLLELVAFLETTYGLKIENDELVPDNLDSLQQLAAFVGRKRAAVNAS